jgi:hypothetical protein
MSLLMLFLAFTNSHPGTLLINHISSSIDSQESSTDDLSSSALLYDSDRETLVYENPNINAQIIMPMTICYRDINLFLLRNPDNPKRDILIAEVDFQNLKNRLKDTDR